MTAGWSENGLSGPGVQFSDLPDTSDTDGCSGMPDETMYDLAVHMETAGWKCLSPTMSLWFFPGEGL